MTTNQKPLVFVGHNGVRAEVRWGLPRGRRGVDGVTKKKSPTEFEIHIKHGQKPLAELDTLIHELLHSSLWAASEEWVEDTAAGIAAVLWKRGYRREGENT